jgi:hypothetical protein
MNCLITTVYKTTLHQLTPKALDGVLSKALARSFVQPRRGFLAARMSLNFTFLPWKGWHRVAVDQRDFYPHIYLRAANPMRTIPLWSITPGEECG